MAHCDELRASHHSITPSLGDRTNNSHQAHDICFSSSMPAVFSYKCVLMFLDVSGFTALANILDPENLSSAMNNYMQLLIDEVFEFQGDVLKFAGACSGPSFHTLTQH